jgi:hypothetical protein
MTRTILFAALSLLFSSIPASAGGTPDAPREGVKIQNEAQLLRDYGHRLEKIAQGVYLGRSGPLAGKTIGIGRAGLAYDLEGLRAHDAKSARPDAQRKALIERLLRVPQKMTLKIAEIPRQLGVVRYETINRKLVGANGSAIA